MRGARPEEVGRILQIIDEARMRIRAHGSTQWQDGYPAREDIVHDLARGCGVVAIAMPAARSGYTAQSRKPDEPTDRRIGPDHLTERIVGYAAVVFDGEPAYDAIEGSWNLDGPYVVVHRLAVADEALHRGVATALLRHAAEQAVARGIRNFRIDTAEENMPMREVLRRLGFRSCGRIRYRSGERIAYDKTL